MWTQKRIAEWQLSSFGPMKSALTIVIRANTEMAELLADLSKDPESTDAIVEAADVVIVLCCLADLWATDMSAREYSQYVPSTNMDVAVYANHFLGSAIDDVSDNPYRQPGRALTQIYHLLRILVSRLGSDLQTEIDKKMEINVARKWKIAADGTAQHIKEPAITTGPMSDEEVRKFFQNLNSEIIEKLAKIKMTPEQAEEQRRSFAYGNCAIDNPNVTREMVNKIADKMAEADPSGPDFNRAIASATRKLVGEVADEMTDDMQARFQVALEEIARKYDEPETVLSIAEKALGPVE